MKARIINLTIVECKFFYSRAIIVISKIINLTIVECKYLCFKYKYGGSVDNKSNHSGM